jgi:hypothetical protein
MQDEKQNDGNHVTNAQERSMAEYSFPPPCWSLLARKDHGPARNDVGPDRQLNDRVRCARNANKYKVPDPQTTIMLHRIGLRSHQHHYHPLLARLEQSYRIRSRGVGAARCSPFNRFGKRSILSPIPSSCHDECQHEDPLPGSVGPLAIASAILASRQ